MANQILSTNFYFEMKISGIWYPIFCGKTAEKVTEQDEIEVTQVNSGADRDYVPGMSNFIVNVSGIAILDNTENRISPFYLDQLAVRRSINEYRLRPIDQDGDTLSCTFDAFVRNLTVTKTIPQWAQCSVTLRVTGAISYSTVVPPPATPTCEQEDTIYTELAEGALFVTDALLIPDTGETITILHVSRSGMTYYETTGTPGNLEFLYTPATGKITFQIAGNPAAPDLEPVSIEYKIET